MKMKTLAAAVIFAVMLVSVNVFADGITDWTIGTGGTVSFDGGSALSGTGLPVSSVLGIGTPSNSGVQLGISGGSLSFSDSNYLGNWTWGSGGTLNITGSVLGASGALVSDDFQGVTVVDLSGTSFQVTFGQIQGTINSAVASEFGISDSFAASSLSLTLYSSGALPYGAFSSTNFGGVINAVDSPVSATEPWNLPMALVFFGIVAAIFGMLIQARVLHITVRA